MSSFVIEPTSDTAGGPATSVPGRIYASRPRGRPSLALSAHPEPRGRSAKRKRGSSALARASGSPGYRRVRSPTRQRGQLALARASRSPGNRPEAESAVNRDHLAGNVRRRRAGEEHHHRGYVLRLPEPLGRDQLLLDEVARLVAD